jgi:hypothetical protein
LRAWRYAAKDVAAANYDGQLHAHGNHLGDLIRHPHNRRAIDTKSVITHERFARQFEEDSFMHSAGHMRYFSGY